MESKRKKNILIVLALVFLFVVFTALQIYLESKRGIPLFPGNILIFFIINLNIILILVFLFLIGRTVVKLYVAKRRGIVGAKFRTKLVLSFMFLTVIPALLLFFVAVGFITRSVESWFSERREAALRGAVAIAQDYTRELMERGKKLVELVVSEMDKERITLPVNRKEYWKLYWILNKYKSEFSAKFIEIYDVNGNRIVSTSKKRRSIHDKLNVEKKVKDVWNSGVPQGFKVGRYYCIFYPVKDKKVIFFLAFKLHKSIASAIDVIGASYKEYSKLKLLKEPIKRGYVLTFLMISALILFASVWFGLQIAKGITEPIEALAQATEKVASGDLNVRVETRAEDELALLVRSFNQMTREIARNREELENRRRFMEAVLENVATGVISIDRDGVITSVNTSAKKILGVKDDVIGKRYWEVFPKTEYAPFYNLIREMIRHARKEEKRELAVNIDGEMKHLLVGVSTIFKEEGGFDGLVVVFEDITELIKAQRAEAWEEVARRMAHEIKNPLTPIKLSAQRLKRKFSGEVKDTDSFHRATDTIIRSVDEMKKMVDEFYRFAKLPETVPVPDDIREVIKEVVDLYRASYKGVEFEVEFSDDFPEKIYIDREQMKRVFINLIDNAVEAMEGKGKVLIRGYLVKDEKKVVIEVADTGKGISPEDREKVFVPYFSRKKGGTGLGLAIVDRIIADHGGYVKVKDNKPRGAVFVIELPVRKEA
ncbi:MAG: PAS domain S-box protein [Deferribacteres bacterium]|nr:PAS domain S-box protein [Deferribacteres bacterium]